MTRRIFIHFIKLDLLARHRLQGLPLSLLRSGNEWYSPIWVLIGETQIYIAQAAGIEEAIAKVKTQHPQEIGRLEVITVGGILAPD